MNYVPPSRPSRPRLVEPPKPRYHVPWYSGLLVCMSRAVYAPTGVQEAAVVAFARTAILRASEAARRSIRERRGV